EQQRQMLTHLRDELMWARMLPIGEVLNRFPRMLRELSTTYHKRVNLKLYGTGVLVDKAVLEKLYDPLLHLLRNAFDHGIESPEIRRQQGKSEQGEIEIRAYHKGSQTIIEVKDDGQGLNSERIGRRAVDLGLLSPQQLGTISNSRLWELIFEPGFSTAHQVSELSGRGVGLDVARLQLRSLKGTISVSSSPGSGTTFTLRLPLTLTIAKLLVCFIGSTAIAVPSDSIEELVIPKENQVKQSGIQRFLHWRGQLVPTHRLSDLLEYACPLSESSPSKVLVAVPSPEQWALPMLILRQEQKVFALEVDRLVTEQELVIKPFGSAIAPPSYAYGCTILGDGSLIPV
ncbi:MAG TPA: hybrid sensor histidine kinase/response regulator, partial [Cyanobacteria bacterium UBA12227]|nr:hybrid sensor histidine kinase/response regulator [Cyanobacteria bacterium UBA12227]